MKRILSLLLCVCLTVLTLSPISIQTFCSAEAEEKYFIPAVVFDGLTPGTYRDTEPNWDGTIPLDSEIITDGIWVDKEEDKGFVDAYLPELQGNKTNIHGFIANDNNGDGITESISAMPNNNTGMQYTLGVNTNNDFTAAKGVAIHINCNHTTAFTDQSLLWIRIVLYDSKGNSYEYKPQADAIGSKSFYAKLNDDTLVESDVYQHGYGYWMGNQDGWYIMDLSTFEEGLDLSDIKKIKIKAASNWDSNMTIEDVGFVTDTREFAYELTGYYVNKNINIKSSTNATVSFSVNDVKRTKARPGKKVDIDITPYTDYELSELSVVGADGKDIKLNGRSFIMPEQEVNVTVKAKKEAVNTPDGIDMYSSIWDLSVLTPGDYRDDAEKRDLIIDTNSELYTKNIIIDRETVGAGKDFTNFHGFWAEDMDNDGVVDRLRSHPYDENGMRFTVGVDTKSTSKESEALIMRIDNQQSYGSWNTSSRQEIKLNWIDNNGNSVPLKTGTEAENINIYFIQDVSGKILTYSLSDGTSIVVGKGSGWVVIPFEAFKGMTAIENYTALSIELSSTPNVYTAIYEIGVTSDMEEMIKILNRNPSKFDIKFEESENGSASCDTAKAATGETVSFNAVADYNFVFDKAKIVYETSRKEVEVTTKEFIMPNEAVSVTVFFKVSPYSVAKYIEDVKTPIIDITAPEKEYAITGDKNDYTELINNGTLSKRESFDNTGSLSDSIFNLNGISVKKNTEGDTGITLSAYNNLGFTATLKANAIDDGIDYESIAVYVDNPGSPLFYYPPDNDTFLTFTVYLKDKNGNTDFNNPIEIKKTQNLWGVVPKLIDAETGVLTEKEIGYSPEQDSTLTVDEKHFTQFFVPTGFKGWILLPFNYFAKEFDPHDIAAVKFTYHYSWWDMPFTVYEVALIPSEEHFLRIAGLLDYDAQYDQGELEEIDKSIFELYQDTPRRVRVTVNKDYAPFYTWSFAGKKIKSLFNFNPEIIRYQDEKDGLAKFYDDFGDTILYKIVSNKFPGEAEVSFDVSMDYLNDTQVKLYSYDASTGEFKSLGITSTVKNGNLTYTFTKGGYYAVSAVKLPSKYEETEIEEEETEKELDKTVITDKFTVTENKGHYETIPGKEKYKTVTRITYGALEPWFIIVIIAAALVVVAGATVTVIIIKKRRKGKKQ